MARPRKALAVLKAEGKSHRTKAELEEREKQELEVISDKIEPPSFLSKGQKERFGWYVDELSRLNIIGNVDAELLARYVVSQDQYETVAKKLSRLDPIGQMDEYNKLINIQNKLFTQCRQAGNDLGLSITSRGRLVIPEAEGEKKELTPEEKLFGGALG